MNDPPHGHGVIPTLVEPIKALIEEEPSFGYRTVAGLLGMNKNTVQRIFQLKGRQVRKRAVGRRPRIQALPSAAQGPDERWAADITAGPLQRRLIEVGLVPADRDQGLAAYLAASASLASRPAAAIMPNATGEETVAERWPVKATASCSRSCCRPAEKAGELWGAARGVILGSWGMVPLILSYATDDLRSHIIDPRTHKEFLARRFRVWGAIICPVVMHIMR